MTFKTNCSGVCPFREELVKKGDSKTGQDWGRERDQMPEIGGKGDFNVQLFNEVSLRCKQNSRVGRGEKRNSVNRSRRKRSCVESRTMWRFAL